MGDFVASLSAGAVGGSTLVLVGMVMAATWLSGWYEERARRAEGAIRRGARLRRGFGAVCGTARPVDGRPGGLLVSTTRTQVRFGGGAWRDAGQVTEGSPFAIVLDSGEEVDLDPRDATVDGGPADVHAQAFTRDLVSRVSAGDPVWVTGVIDPRRGQGAGAYRSGVARARITAPRRGQITITRESPAPRWRTLAAAHKAGAFFAVGAATVAHALVFSRYDVALVLRHELCEVYANPGWVLAACTAAWLSVGIAVYGWWRGVARARRLFPR